MIFFRQKALFYFKRQGLEIYLQGKPKLSFDFTSETVVAEEIKDQEKLQIQLTDFLKNNGLINLQAVFVLAEELVFQKNISEKEQFLGEMPFPKEKIISKDFPAKNLVLAVNGELFNLLMNIIAGSGGKVLFVVPATLLGVSAIDDNNFRQILAKESLLRQSDLLNPQNTKRNIDLKLPLILILTVLLLAAGFFYFKALKKPVKETITKLPVQQIVEIKSATASAVVKTQKAKKDLIVKVLNGTGTAGDAKKVKDALEALGFQNVQTDNLEVKNATQSAIIYSLSAVSYLPEITTALRKIFSLEPYSLSTNSASFDFQITTGK